jgi:hypothetical protein
MKNLPFLAFRLFLALPWAWPGGLSAQSTVASNLPLLLLDTDGQNIDQGSGITAQLKIIDNAGGQPNHPFDAPAYEGPVSIRIRGNFSAVLPQKPYGFETLDPATGLDTSVALLGMPPEEDWILLALWNDKSFVRNSLLFDLARKMGHYAPRTRHVEVLLNGQYEGLYVFCEKIKRDDQRVKLKKLTPADNTFPKISGGYIFKHDYANEWETQNWIPANCPDRRLNFETVYPRQSDISSAQFDYLRDYLDSVEIALLSPTFGDSLAGFRQFIDEPSWADYLLLNELAGNGDGYKKSMFFHKDRGERLRMGPIWDFDWAMKFFPWGPPDASGWYYANEPCNEDVLIVPYFQRLMEDEGFHQAAACRWATLRTGLLDTTYLFGYIDSVAAVADAAQIRHFARWDCLGYDSGAPEVPPYPSTYAGEVEKLKQWFRLRVDWMDSQWLPVACTSQSAQPWASQGAAQVFPNPASDFFEIKIGSPWERAVLRNALGQPVRVFVFGEKMRLAGLPSGVYALEVFTGKRTASQVLRVLKP